MCTFYSRLLHYGHTPAVTDMKTNLQLCSSKHHTLINRQKVLQKVKELSFMHDVQLGTHHLGSTITLFSWFHKAISTLWRVQQLRETEMDIYMSTYLSGIQMDER